MNSQLNSNKQESLEGKVFFGVNDIVPIFVDMLDNEIENYDAAVHTKRIKGICLNVKKLLVQLIKKERI